MTERYPAAEWLPIPEHDEQGSYTKTQLIFHSTGTTASARNNARYFGRRDVAVESTFIIDSDGSVLQVMPCSARADANGTANRRAISVEVVGTADQPFTQAQLEACIALARWVCDNHPVERRRIPSESESGVGWHVMFGAPGPWTSVRGKECPGSKRIVQVAHVIIPAVQSGPAAVVPEEDDDMASFTFNDGDKTYWRDGGDTIHIPSMDDVNKLHAAGVKKIGSLSPELTRRLVEAAKQ